MFLTPLLALQIGCRPDHRAFVAPESGLYASPASLSLGPVAIDAAETATVMVTNPDPATVSVVVALHDADGEALALDGSVGLSLLTEPEVTVDAGGGTASLELSWAPLDGSGLDGTLSLVASDGRALLDLPLTARVDPDGDDDGDPHPAAGGGDCDDADPGISSDAVETWYDGVDQDCDGNDDDADDDGTPGGPDGDDCDDHDAGVYPGAVDLLDGVDEDCDGVVDEDAAAAGLAVFSELETCLKTGGCVGTLELFLRDGVGVEGWEIAALSSGEATPLTHDPDTAPGPWLHVCGPDDTAATCGVLAEAWPALDPAGDTLILTADGVEIDRFAWDGTYGVADGPIQLDSARAVSGANDTAEDWCPGSSPGEPNERCD